MGTSRLQRLITLAVLISAGVSGCAATAGQGSTGPGTDSTESDESVAGRSERGSVTPPEDESERFDLTDERVVGWLRYRAVSPREVRFIVATGDPACNGLRTVVEETDVRVRIAVVEGTPPEAPQHCTLVGTEARLLVTLDDPLGDRELLPLEARDVDLAGG